MKPKITAKLLLLAAAASLGVAGNMRADDLSPPPLVPPSGMMGLLGQTYASLVYSYLDLDSSPVHADAYGFEYNQPLNAGLDGILRYEFNQTGLLAGSRFNRQTLGGALRAFSASCAWGKPYAEAGLGYTWTRFAGADDNSVVWEAAVGTEFQVAPALSVTPFVKYQDAPDLASGSTWNYGVKANYWVDSQWAITGGLERNDNQNMRYTVGTNFRF